MSTSDEKDRLRGALNEAMISLQSAVAHHLCARVHNDTEWRDEACDDCRESAAGLLHDGWDAGIINQTFPPDEGGAS